MKIQFRKEEEYFTFHDPMQDGKLIDRKTEIRFDPLTGETARILFDPGAPFAPTDFSEEAAATTGKKCPFCPENVYDSTPRFPDELIEGGRLVHGEAVAFPNLFPYSKHNAVVRMSDQHYVKLDEFTVPLMKEAFITAHQYVEKVLEFDSKTTYASINWNYLPPSGGSIIHPHIHVLASEHPTNYQASSAAFSRQFQEREGVCYYSTLAAEEKRLGERWIGTKGSIDWIHAFAPVSHADFIGICDAASFKELTDTHYESLAESLTSFFAYFQQAGINSFNLGFFIPLSASEGERFHVRLIPRMTIGMLKTSDMNVFNYLHREPLSLKAPEHVAKAVQIHFA
ncbi:galactose-1-phosphate uridylyltransferase [Sporosarcina luteola]|nr:galactose-1-phosphate uridylyltransferase [Sporosarcina luteola]